MIYSNVFGFTVLIVIISTLKSATSLSCYQCNSTDIHNQFQCTETMDTYGLEPQPCTNVYNAAFCVKLIGRFERGLGVKRYCSSHDLGNYCNYVRQPGDKLEYRTCVYTCDSDGCNGSSQVKLYGYLIVISLFPMLKLILI
ncbi:uncharacterized protein LOC112683103 [Sipha flava]|uniref:Uncharacterized protein LOC112683103 n=1 Tax=Sipha flava TaxID=143950 RepID=A0A8B8FGV2_9HEMI|nr:uncharacterized protein LOC112683103 [Sipha flava]